MQNVMKNNTKQKFETKKIIIMGRVLMSKVLSSTCAYDIYSVFQGFS